MSQSIQPNIDFNWLESPASVTGLPEMRPYTFKELCNMYQIKYRAMRKMLVPLAEKLGKPTGRYYSVRQMETIFNVLGPPYHL